MDGAYGESRSSEQELPEVIVAEDLLTIDVSGASGDRGRDGRSYGGSQASRSQDGRPGGEAQPAEPGQAAGEIELTLRSTTGEQRVEVSGRKRVPSGGREQLIRETVAIGVMGDIRLRVCGGRGGDGGNGGDGEAGGKGHDGSDATRFSSGSDGGPGGDGGRGGDGTSGADGGDGGRVAVQVDQSDTHLLMLVQHAVDGGEGGQPGSNGRGGEGGPGGDGGRSYSWTTTSQEHYTDAQGHRQTRTVTHHHSNSGGFDGPSGHRGSDGQALLHAGAEGQEGDFRILVRHDDQITQYRQRYDVAVEGFELHLADLFAEPTSEVRVGRVTLCNTGGMPTPDRFPVEVTLAASRWVVPTAAALTLPRALQPGESFTFEQDVLRAQVPDIDAIPVGDPLCERDRIAPLARQSGVNRWFSNLHPRQEFEISFPSELNTIGSLESQTPGGAATLTIGMTNRSQHDLGSRSSSRRVLRIQLELTNQEFGQYVMLLDMQGNRIEWQTGYVEEIELLTPGESWSRQLVLGVLPGAPAYRQAELAVTLHLGQLDRPEQTKGRQCLLYPVRVAQAYQYDSTADILLITNHGTTTDELAAWQEAAARLGQTIAVWDISLNDALSLSRDLAHGQNLFRDFHGKTIVLSNAPFFTALGTRYGDQFLNQMDLIKAAESHGIRFLIINDQEHELAHLFQERLIPTDGEPEFRYDSIRGFKKSQPSEDDSVLFDQVDELIKHGAQAARPDPLRQTSEIDLYAVRSPNPRRLHKQAARLQRQLQHASPGRRMVVMYRMPHEASQEEQQLREARDQAHPPGGWFFTHEYQGTLTVMPTIGDDHPNLVVLNALPDQIHDRQFILGADVSSALLQALSCEEKVYLLSSRMRELGEAWRIDPGSMQESDVRVAQFLVDAILVDLATEQAAVLVTPWKSLWGGGVVRKALSQLTFLAAHQFPFVTGDAREPDVQLAARLAAGVKFLGESASLWYESRLFPWGFFRRGPVLRSAILAHQKELEANLFRQPNADQSRLMDDLLRQYRGRVSELRRQAKSDKRTAARSVLFAPLLRYGIHTDAGRTFPTVLSLEQWQVIRKSEEQREASRVALRAKKEEDGARYAVARDGQPLPGIEPAIERALQSFVDACSKFYNTEPQRSPTAEPTENRQRSSQEMLPEQEEA